MLETERDTKATDLTVAARHHHESRLGHAVTSGYLIPLAITGTYSGAIVMTRWSPL
nr:hypothetical protein SHINE37_41747 [Rhizobiaceae bacterium]